MANDSSLTLSLLDAARLAAAAHDGQRRKTEDVPYVVHPLRVAARVASLQLDDALPHGAMILAAVLHDVLEDTDVPADEIERRFGAQVLGIVQELTQDMSVPKVERRSRMIAHCATMSRAAQIIKLADRADNMSEMGGMPAQFITRYCREAREMLANMRGACAELEDEIIALIERYEPTLGGTAGS